MEVGLYTLNDLTSSPLSGQRMTAAQRVRETIAAAKLADEVGLDIFGVGEHHRLDFAVSAPAVVLSAIAAETKKIRLTSAVTVLGAADPVRVYQDFATLDLVSEGRAEIMAGRGAFIDPFPLFGYDVNEYDEIFVEHFHLLRQLTLKERVTWTGKFRPPLQAAEIAPRPIQVDFPIWIAVGGSPESAARAGALGAPMALAALGGPIVGLKRIVALYRGAARANHKRPRVALSGHTHIGSTSQSAREKFFPHHAQYWRHVSGGRVTPMTRDQFDLASGPGSALMVGSPAEITDRILLAHETLGVDRFLAQVDLGALPFSEVAAVIERLGTRVAPAVRQAIGVGTTS